MATIYDVAKVAGVSAKTVSRVLNGDGPVGRETREAVEAAMRDLGYVPSNAARMMRASKSGLVGLITGAISTAGEIARPAGLPDLFIVQGIQQVMAQAGMTLMIADTAGRSETVPHLIDTFLSHRVEGLIYVAEYHQQVRLPKITGQTPLVLVNCFDDAGTPAVVPDDQRGQYALVNRLIRAGFKVAVCEQMENPKDAKGVVKRATARHWPRQGCPMTPPLCRTATLRAATAKPS